jgi:hypothetical protein
MPAAPLDRDRAVMMVLSDIFEAVDDSDVASPVLLDLSAAFDTVDHARHPPTAHPVAVWIRWPSSELCGGLARIWPAGFSIRSSRLFETSRRCHPLQCCSEVGPRNYSVLSCTQLT